MDSKPSDGVCKRIRDKHPEIDPVEFHEFVKSRLSLTYAQGDGVLDKATIPRVVEFLIVGEETHFLDSHLEDFNSCKQRQVEIAETLKIKSLVPIKAKEVEADEINRAVKAGGLTLIHTMVEDRNLGGIIELHEQQGAKINVKDNSRQTPLDLARSLGYVEIVAYLEDRFAGEKKSK